MDDFWDGLFDFLSDMCGEVGIWFAPLSVILLCAVGYGVWWEFIR